MDDFQNPDQETPDIPMDPLAGNTGFWAPHPPWTGTMTQQLGSPDRIVLPEEDFLRSRSDASWRDGQHDFQNVLPGNQLNQLEYMSNHERQGDSFAPVGRNIARSYGHNGHLYETQQPYMYTSTYSMEENTFLQDGPDWPHVPSDGRSHAYPNCFSGVADGFRQIIPQSCVFDIPGVREQAALSKLAPITGFQVRDSELQWNYNEPQSGSFSSKDPWSQFAQPTMRPSLPLVSQSHSGYGQIPEHSIGQANVPLVGRILGGRGTDLDQNMGVSPTMAQECFLSPSTPAIQVMGSFVDNGPADHSSSEEARSPDTGSQEIVFSLKSGDPVTVKKKRIVPKGQREESQYIRNHGGPCDACRRGKRKVCSPSVSPLLNDTDCCQVPAVSH